MMQKIIAVALFFLLCIGCAGCQKTPERPIAIGNDTEKLIEQAQEEDADAASESSAPLDLYTRLHAPATYSQEITSKVGRLHVFADAKVLLPSCELPIVRVKPVEFTLAQARRFAEVLMGNDATYVQYDYENETRGAYERRIERLRYALSDWAEVGQYIFDLQYNTEQEAEEAMRKLIAKAGTAPEAYPTYTPEFEWERRPLYVNGVEKENNDTYFDLYSTKDQRVFSRLSIRNAGDGFGMIEMEYIRDDAIPMDVFNYESNSRKTEAAELAVTPEDAQQLAKNTLSQMGIEGFVCAANLPYLYRTDYNDYRPAHFLTFKREVNGAVETCTNAMEASNEYNQSWKYEAVYLLIDDDGIVRFEYKAPCEIVEMVAERPELLPFPEIQGIFEKMCVIVDNKVDYNDLWDSGSMEYHVTTVRLGLVSIQEKNENTRLLVPAWDFLGYERARRTAEDEWRTTGDTSELEPYLTVNAIDGTIITRGY